MNTSERITELRTLLCNQPDCPNEEFAVWQARVSALIGFDREQQKTFRAMADNAPSYPDNYAEYGRRLRTIILQAIADLEVGPIIAAEPPAELPKQSALDRFVDAVDLRPGAFGVRFDLKKVWRRKQKE